MDNITVFVHLPFLCLIGVRYQQEGNRGETAKSGYIQK